MMVGLGTVYRPLYIETMNSVLQQKAKVQFYCIAVSVNGAAGRIRTCEPLRERISHPGA
jgi:hypothetical protein